MTKERNALQGGVEEGKLQIGALKNTLENIQSELNDKKSVLKDFEERYQQVAEKLKRAEEKSEVQKISINTLRQALDTKTSDLQEVKRKLKKERKKALPTKKL